MLHKNYDSKLSTKPSCTYNQTPATLRFPPGRIYYTRYHFLSSIYYSYVLRNQSSKLQNGANLHVQFHSFRNPRVSPTRTQTQTQIITITSILKLHLQVIHQILHLELPKGANLHIEPQSSADLRVCSQIQMNHQRQPTSLITTFLPQIHAAGGER